MSVVSSSARSVLRGQSRCEVIVPARAGAVIDRPAISSSTGRTIHGSTDWSMPDVGRMWWNEGMQEARITVPPPRRRDAPTGRTSEAACPPIGPEGRWTALSHALFYGAVASATAMASPAWPPDPTRGAREVALATLLVVWYSYWIVRRGHDVASSSALGALYFGVSALLWTGLLTLDPAYELLFPTVFAQVLGYLPWRAAILAMALASILVHTPEVIRTGGVGLGHVVFAVVGLGILTLIILSLRAITDQSNRRQELIEALKATRDELARMERHAGILEERQRLAGEVHDTLAQAFTSIVMLLETAQAAVESGSAGAAGHVAQALNAARGGLREVRRIVWALRPESLERGSLAQALDRATSRLAHEAGITARTVITGEARPLPPELEITLLRATQEALANVRRHARARHVTVTLSYMEDVVVLDVCDDGVGFDPAALPTEPGRHGGLGLVAMRERVEALHGSLSVESRPEGGSTLVVELPTPRRVPEETRGSEVVLP
jgi:signal transduction histidine kinase